MQATTAHGLLAKPIVSAVVVKLAAGPAFTGQGSRLLALCSLNLDGPASVNRELVKVTMEIRSGLGYPSKRR
jgi:hypothetical protein